MANHLMVYEVFVTGPELPKVKEKLNEYGRKGYHIEHTRVDEEGKYTFVMSRDTGREPIDEQHSEWVDDGFVNEETSWT